MCNSTSAPCPYPFRAHPHLMYATVRLMLCISAPPPLPTPDVRNREVDAVHPQGLRKPHRLVATAVLFPVAVERDEVAEGSGQVLLQDAEQ